MRLTSSAVRHTNFSWIGGALLLTMAPVAMAVPPSFSGTITAPIPAVGQSVIVNLRQQSVVSGSSPVSITTGQGVVLLNGQFVPASGLLIAPFDQSAQILAVPGVDELGACERGRPLAAGKVVAVTARAPFEVNLFAGDGLFGRVHAGPDRRRLRGEACPRQQETRDSEHCSPV